jgi:hypothetical protein
MKSLSNTKNLSRNPPQGACSGFLIATFYPKGVPQATCDPEIVPKGGHECTVHWRKSTTEGNDKPEQKKYVAAGKPYRISKSFQRSKQKLNTL